jgi:CDP-diacylglycerol--glycerol-3-phosphate 3-phosphatidyltransferase
MNLANLLTLCRLLLAIPFCLLMMRQGWGAALPALLIACAAVATDLLDGPLARRRGTAGPSGGAFDHTTDFLFVASGMFAGVAGGAFPWVLPALVCVAFAQYVFDSYVVYRHGQLFRSRLGRLNGILYFVPLFSENLIRLGAGWLRPAQSALVWLLVASTLVSMGQRLLHALRRRTSPPARG